MSRQTLFEMMREREFLGDYSECFTCFSQHPIHTRDCEWARQMRIMGGDAEATRQLDACHELAILMDRRRTRDLLCPRLAHETSPGYATSSALLDTEAIIIPR